MSTEVEEIKARLNIVELVGSYVKLVKSGAHWKAPCPFHNEKTPSFMVNEERQIWHCFGCQKGGDAFSFLMEIEGIDFREALRLLAERTGVELSHNAQRDGYPETKSRSTEILELAAKFYEKQLWDGPGKTRALPYLTDRGLTEESVRIFRLGYAPAGWRNLSGFLVSRGYEAEEIERAGLAIRKENGNGHYDRFRERIIFPIMDALGRVVGFTARVEPGVSEDTAKYVNTPETDTYHKSRALYGIQQAKQAMKQENFALLVEGNMDVIAAHQAGFHNTIAVSGTALTEEQLKIIKRYTRHLRMFFDMDSAGQTAARRSAELALRAGMQVSIVAIEGGKDAAELAQGDPEALRRAIASSKPAMEYFLDRLLVRYNKRDPEGRRDIVGDYAGLLASVADPVERGAWLKRFAETIETEERLIVPAVEQALGQDRARPAGPQTAIESVSDRTASTGTFTRRSEALRYKISMFALLDGAVWDQVLSTVDDDVREFLIDEPIIAFLWEQGGFSGGNFSVFSDKATEPSQKNRLIARYFDGERALVQEGLAAFRDEERTERLVGLTRGYTEELAKELKREVLLALEREMKRAGDAGDAVREKALREEFARRLQS